MPRSRINIQLDMDDTEKFVKRFKNKLEEYANNAEAYNTTFKSQKLRVFSSATDAINDFKAEQVSMRKNVEVFENELDQQVDEIANMYITKVMKDILGE